MRTYRTLIVLTLNLITLGCLAQQKSFVEKIGQYLEKYPQEKIFVHTDKPYYIAGDTIWFRSYLTDAFTHQPVNSSNFIYLELHRLKPDSLIARVKIKRDSIGIFANCIPIPSSLKGGTYSLAAYTEWMRNFGSESFFYKQMRIAGLENEKPLETKTISKIDLSVLPEGGQLIKSCQQRVAFKVIGDNGLGVDAEVRLVDGYGNVIKSTKTIHRGMGYIHVTQDNTKDLFLEAYTADNLTSRQRIPKALVSGASLMVSNRRGQIFIHPFVSDDLKNEEFEYVLYGGGKTVCLKGRGDEDVSVLSKDLVPGIVNIVMVNEDKQQPIAERLLFIRDVNSPKIGISSDKVGHKELQTIDLNIENLNINENTFLSVSVVDGNVVRQDTTQASILASLLLSSELNGYIEEPDFYFRKSDHTTDACLDLLMMTQGWRRYGCKEIIDEEKIKLDYTFEKSQYLTGKVYGPFLNAYNQPQIYIWSPNSRIRGMIKFQDKVKKFRIEDLDFSDGTQFVLSALSRKGKSKGMGLDVTNQDFPKITLTPDIYMKYNLSFDNFAKQERDNQKWLRIHNVVYLPEVNAVASKKKTPVNMKCSPVSANRSAKEGDPILEYNSMNSLLANFGLVYKFSVDLEDVMRSENASIGDEWAIHGVYPATTIRQGRTYPIAVYVNDMKYYDFDMNMISPVDIQEIYYYKAGNLALGAYNYDERSSGVLNIYTKPGVSFRKVEGIRYLTPLGYKKPVEFYSPKYKVKDKEHNPDRRTTLYWSPAVKVNQSRVAKLSFYTSDVSEKYLIVVQGVTSNGTIIDKVCEF